MEELGLTLVDEGGLTLRQLMRQARQRIMANGGSVIGTSVETFMEFVGNNPNVFRLLLRERSGTSPAFRAAVAREIAHFIAELTDYLELQYRCPREDAQMQAEAMVTLVFNAGASALDLAEHERQLLIAKTVKQLRIVAKGAALYNRSEALS